MLTSNLQHYEGHQKQGKSEKLSEPRGASEEMTTKSNVVSRMGSWTPREIVRKN